MLPRRRRSGNVTNLIHDPDYVRAPATPDPEWLEQNVQAYRDGDTARREPLINAHLHFVASIAGDLSRARNKEDVLGEALLALVDAVDRAQTALQDNNITPYIAAVVKDKIKDFIARDRTVYMPARTFRHKIAKGEILAEGNDDPIIVGVVSSVKLVESDVVDKEDSSGDTVRLNHHTSYVVPIAEPTEESPEFKEALTLAIHTDTERRIIDLRLEGYKYEDMETVLGLKKSRIGEHLSNVRNRFMAVYAG